MANLTLTINLRKRLLRIHMPQRKHRVIAAIKESVARFSKSDIEKIKIHKGLNEYLEKNTGAWASLKVDIVKTDGRVDVALPGTKIESISSTSKSTTKEKKTEMAAPKAEAKEKKPEENAAKQQKQA